MLDTISMAKQLHGEYKEAIDIKMTLVLEFLFDIGKRVCGSVIASNIIIRYGQ